jgi:hypothetical protein
MIIAIMPSIFGPMLRSSFVSLRLPDASEITTAVAAPIVRIA